MEQTKKFFVYARKSTDDKDRQVRSIADQLSELQEIAKKENLEIVDIFIEKQTAKVPGRPIFREMITRLEAGEAQGILAWHPDRLARNSIDGGRVIYLVDTKIILDLKFSTFWFDPTPQGKFMLSIAFSQSKYYVDNLSENIKRGQRNKVKSGIWPQSAPIGYINDNSTKTLFVDEVKSPLIKQAFETYAQGGYTLKRLRDSFNALGLTGKRTTLSVSNYHNMLRNPFYYGVMRYGGELYEGKHPPIISKSLFDECQEVMKRKSKSKTKTLKPYLYRGVFRCAECNCFITSETQKGHNYLHCTKRVKVCLQKYVREENISLQVVSFLQKTILPEYASQWMLAEIEKEQKDYTKENEDFVRQTQSKIQELFLKIEKLTTLYIENGISIEEYKSMKEKMISEKVLYQDKLKSAEQNTQERFEPIVSFLKANISNDILLTGGKSEEILSIFQKVSSNPKIKDKEILVEPRSAWRTLYLAGLGGIRTAEKPAFGGRASIFSADFSELH
ncbi:MAG: site-specific recombinase, partial [Patescibacteria group bacterium]|nr:site-specific recombinase [Patescibacteria group bacterium]